ncbi:MAG: hypothetical protein ABW174_10560, partial [Flavitalea sp.]
MRSRIFFSLFSLIPACLMAGTINIAPHSKVTASTSKNNKFQPSNLTDGIISVDGMGEWACEGVTTSWGYIRFPWARLEWDKTQTIKRIILYDRPSEEEHAATVKIHFSDGTFLWMNQIPNDGTARRIDFPAKKTKWIKLEVTDGTGKDVGFSEVEVYAEQGADTDPVNWVDPYIETNRGRDFFFITGSRPFGMLTSAPMTRNKNQGGGAYNYNENEILGFEQIHDWMIAGLEIMPASANADPIMGHKGWKSKFSHDDELVEPGYHRVFLRDPKIWVEQTSTERVGLYRFRFTEKMKAQIITNLGGFVISNRMTNAEIKKVSDTEFEGSFSTVDRFWGGPKDVRIFFSVRFDKPFQQLSGWNGNKKTKDIEQHKGENDGV